MFSNLVDRLLLKIDKENIINLFKQGSTAKEVASELGFAQSWVEGVIEDYEIEFINDLNAELIHND